MLHRALGACLCLGVLLVPASAQIRKRAKGPRALAVVEFPATGSPRIVPVAILINGRYYDASVYMASPVPMALEPGTVYEVERSGESQGLITVTNPKEAGNDNWYALGDYRTNAMLAKMRAPKKAEPDVRVEPEAGPPRLRHGGRGRRSGGPDTPRVEQTPAPKPAPSPPEGQEDPDRPKLKKPPAEESTQPAPAAQAQPAPPAPSAPPPDTDTSGRPVLRRGKPAIEQAEKLPEPASSPAAAKSGSPTAPGAPQKPAASHLLAAISDAGGPEPRSFAFPWSDQELAKLKGGMETLATAALADYARSHPGARPGKLENSELRAFDLDFNNSPDVVLTAQAGEAPATPVRRTPGRGQRAAPPEPAPAAGSTPGLTYWVTVAAREDLSGNVRKVKTWVTDSKHLDAFPRMELIDAVDADGDGRGELLFREVFDLGRGFVLYRVNGDILTELYDSAAQGQ